MACYTQVDDTGEEAKGPTAHEYAEQVMKPLIRKADAIMKKWAYKLHNPAESSPIYSMDNPRIHTKALREYFPDLMEGEDLFPLPPYAGDVHKVIEHVHGILSKQMQVILRHIRKKQSVWWYRHHLSEMFFKYGVNSVQRDVMSLPDTLALISKPPSRGGTGGGWAPRPYN